jgi:hypothetical protein
METSLSYFHGFFVSVVCVLQRRALVSHFIICIEISEPISTLVLSLGMKGRAPSRKVSSLAAAP